MYSEADELRWRAVMAALSNPHVRHIFAELELGAPLEAVGKEMGASRRRRALTTLRKSGLVHDVDGETVINAEVFPRALASAPPPARPTGVERFLMKDGRIDRYPDDATERAELLALLASQALDVGEVVTEREVTDRLTRFTDDPAGLRRAMVDEEILERTRSGSEYARVVS